jgi:hypothetical protein
MNDEESYSFITFKRAVPKNVNRNVTEENDITSDDTDTEFHGLTMDDDHTNTPFKNKFKVPIHKTPRYNLPAVPDYSAIIERNTLA